MLKFWLSTPHHASFEQTLPNMGANGYVYREHKIFSMICEEQGLIPQKSLWRWLLSSSLTNWSSHLRSWRLSICSSMCLFLDDIVVFTLGGRKSCSPTTSPLLWRDVRFWLLTMSKGNRIRLIVQSRLLLTLKDSKVDSETHRGPSLGIWSWWMCSLSAAKFSIGACSPNNGRPRSRRSISLAPGRAFGIWLHVEENHRTARVSWFRCYIRFKQARRLRPFEVWCSNAKGSLRLDVSHDDCHTIHRIILID